MSTDSHVPSTRASAPKGYGWTLIACVITTLVATPLREHLDLTNIVMLFLLTVLLVAVKFGRGPAVLASLRPGLRAGTIAGALSLGEIGSSMERGYPLFHNATLVVSRWR